MSVDLSGSTTGMLTRLLSDRCEMNITSCWILMLLSVPASAACASEVILQCPAYIEVKQEVKAVPEGWQAYEPSTKHPLVTIEFSEGNPTQRVLLLPTGEQGRSISTWTFTPSDEGHWVSCGYNSTSIVTSRKLPTGTRTCQVEYDDDFSPPIVKRYNCMQR